MRITRKVGLLVAVPLLAALAFAALAVVGTGGQAVRAEQLRRLVAASQAAGQLVGALQAERAAALLELTGADSAELAEVVAGVDAAVAGYERARAELPRLPAGAAAAVVGRIDGQLGRLAGLREQVAAGSGRASATAFAYRILIADLVAFRGLVGQAGGASADLADRLRAAAALSQATEQVGLQQAAVLRAAGFGPLSPAAAREITAAVTGHADALSTFDAFARPRWRAALDDAAAGAEALTARELEDAVARTPVGGRLEVDRARWAEVTTARMVRLHQVEARVDADLLVEVSDLRDARRWLAGGQIAAVLVAVSVAVALAAGLGRPVVRGLRGLRDAAHEVAFRGLPAVVARLDQGEGLGGLSPAQWAERVPPPVRVRGRDELAEVGAAFNAVHRAAVRTAAEQAQLRLSIAAIMLNLARRGQKLTGRLTAALDEVERDELDPNRLAQLYQLDLMATLLGGTNESLLVLGGGGAAVVRSSDEPLANVLRAAQGRVEQYTRITFGVIDEGVSVRAQAVDDVVKLLAELLDNACRYSPPARPVLVSGRWLSDRAIVQIADEGVGIPPARRAELNARLATRPPLDLAAVEAMGLTVVAYLAARHQIRVELRAHERGAVAEVELPLPLLAANLGWQPPQPAWMRPDHQVVLARPRELAAPPGLRLAGYPSAGRPPQPVTAGPTEPVTAGPAEPAGLPQAGGLDAAASTQELALPIYQAVAAASPWFTLAHPDEGSRQTTMPTAPAVPAAPAGGQAGEPRRMRAGRRPCRRPIPARPG